LVAVYVRMSPGPMIHISFGYRIVAATVDEVQKVEVELEAQVQVSQPRKWAEIG
jgi:hypothetical protein